ncbi:putative glycosyltransferase [Candidatus Promineifilum breve]|uniref:Glycosyltransferase n=1 Tax=Candidatus Promineifilum breve TaxID=1806508 RepID=A0A170PDT0_9CHLR|nr:glycosyltransferase [Candidatus Promineifilum breve]CUS02193.2 putative glycosyltransferase [Candidatus Promineifilum breve]
MTNALVGLYVVTVLGLAVYGLLGFCALGLFLRHRHDSGQATTPVNWQTLPAVTVQLPVYNERAVIGRLIAAAAALEYPRDRLQIQVLDDSTDETTALAAEAVAEYAAAGLDISLVHRANRRGYKAGALGEGLAAARGEFIAIFDADFVPAPDFLLRTVPPLLADSAVGAVQARWGHLNDAESILTGAQAVALDKHFIIEQLVRFRAELFPKFNGSAGVWRRACVVDVGGWQDDTVCEDLCLSTRAVLAGWKFYFAADVVAPAELPPTITAYKAQQARWAMGGTQCLTKYAAPICRARQTPFARLYALLTMSAYFSNALVLLLVLVQIPLLLSEARLPVWLMPLGLAGLGQPILFALAQKTLYPDWPTRLRRLPALLLIAFGMAPNNSWAVWRGLFSRDVVFIRTPKGQTAGYHLSPGRMLAVEVALTVYSATALFLAISLGNSGAIVFLLTAVLSFSYVALLGLRESRTPKPVAAIIS